MPFVRILVSILFVTVALHAQAQMPTNPPSGTVPPVIFTGGGTYTGPGDLVPPAGSGGLPPGSFVCGAPCGPLNGFPSTCQPCHGVPTNTNNGFAPDGTTFEAAPSSIANCPLYFYEITIGELLLACAQATAAGEDVVNFCIPVACGDDGIDQFFVHATPPFQATSTGLPTAGGNFIPVCGITYNVQAKVGTQCFDLGMGFNDTNYHLNCEVADCLVLQFSCACLTAELATLQSFGLYGSANSVYNNRTPAFVALLKCWGSSGSGGGDM